MPRRIWLAALLFLSLRSAWAGAPLRIASGTVGTDEILIEILGRRHEVQRLVAVSTFSDNRNYSHIERVPDFIKGRVGDSIEALLALKPDLVLLASYNRPELSRQLQAAGIQTVTLEHFRSLADIMSNIQTIGRVTGTEKEATSLLRELQMRLQAVKSHQPCQGGAPTFIQYTGYDTVPGTDTIINDAAAQAGLQNLAARLKLRGWATLSQEVLVSLDPDLIIMAGDPKRKQSALSTLKRIPAWQKLKAVQAGRLWLIPERELNTVSHHVAKLVESLAAARDSICRH